MDPIRNIIKVRVNNQDYLYQYENAWDKEKQRSYSKHRTTVGKLVNGKVQLGRKFLANNPQYKDIEFKFEDHKLIAASDLPTVNDAGVNAVLSKTFPLNAGASYVLKEIAQQDGPARGLESCLSAPLERSSGPCNVLCYLSGKEPGQLRHHCGPQPVGRKSSGFSENL